MPRIDITEELKPERVLVENKEVNPKSKSVDKDELWVSLFEAAFSGTETDEIVEFLWEDNNNNNNSQTKNNNNNSQTKNKDNDDELVINTRKSNIPKFSPRQEKAKRDILISSSSTSNQKDERDDVSVVKSSRLLDDCRRSDVNADCISIDGSQSTISRTRDSKKFAEWKKRRKRTNAPDPDGRSMMGTNDTVSICSNETNSTPYSSSVNNGIVTRNLKTIFKDKPISKTEEVRRPLLPASSTSTPTTIQESFSSGSNSKIFPTVRFSPSTEAPSTRKESVFERLYPKKSYPNKPKKLGTTTSRRKPRNSWKPIDEGNILSHEARVERRKNYRSQHDVRRLRRIQQREKKSQEFIENISLAPLPSSKSVTPFERLYRNDYQTSKSNKYVLKKSSGDGDKCHQSENSGSGNNMSTIKEDREKIESEPSRNHQTTVKVPLSSSSNHPSEEQSEKSGSSNSISTIKDGEKTEFESAQNHQTTVKLPLSLSTNQHTNEEISIANTENSKASVEANNLMTTLEKIIENKMGGNKEAENKLMVLDVDINRALPSLVDVTALSVGITGYLYVDENVRIYFDKNNNRVYNFNKNIN